MREHRSSLLPCDETSVDREKRHCAEHIIRSYWHAATDQRERVSNQGITESEVFTYCLNPVRFERK